MKNHIRHLLSKRAASATLFHAPLALLALFWCAGLLCPASHAAIPSSAEGWFMPTKFTTDKLVVSYVEKGKNGEIEYAYYIGEAITEGWGEKGAPQNPPGLATAIEYAAEAHYAAARNEEKIETIGKNLYAALGNGKIIVQGTDAKGSTVSYSLNFVGGSIQNAQQGNTIIANNPALSHNFADERTLQWNAGKGGDFGNMSLYGSDTVDDKNSEQDFWGKTGAYFPYLVSGSSVLNWAKFGGYNPSIFQMADENYKYLTLKGWKGGDEESTGLSALLTKENATARLNYCVLARKGSGTEDTAKLAYIPLGDVINLTNALKATEACNTSLSALLTTPPTGDVDHYLLSFYGGQLHHLPVGKGISTNGTGKVKGDNASISVIKEDATGEQAVSIAGWNNVSSSAENPLFLAHAGGSLSYLPIAFPEDTCTQKWESVAAWIGSTAKNGEKTLTLPKESLAEYLKKEHGMVYSTTVDADLHFEGSTDNIEASFTAPKNWADDSTIKVNENGKYTLKTDDPCDTTLTKILDDPSTSTAHSFLALETTSGNLHYVPVGAGLKGGIQPDGVSIVSNETGLAIAGYANASPDTVLTRSEDGLSWKDLTTPEPIAVDGVSIVSNETGLAIAGYANASADTVLTRSSNGVEWKSVTADGDDTTITKTDDNKLTLTGFSAAANGSQAVKGADGVLAWSELVSITNTYTLLAGAGINITKNDDSGVVTISAQPLTTSSTPSTINIIGGENNYVQFSLLSDIQYDEATHRLQVKKSLITIPVAAHSETDWKTVFTAVSHASEHTTTGATE